MEVKCEKCGRLLTIIKNGSRIEIEIKCNRCKHINLIKIQEADPNKNKPSKK